MYLHISILSFIAEDGLFFDEPPASLDLDATWSFNAASSNNLNMADLDQSFIFGDPQYNDFDITPVAPSILGEDLIWTNQQNLGPHFHTM